MPQSRLLQNTLTNVVGRFATAGLSILLTAYLARHLGSSLYGLLMLLRGLAGNVTILETLFGAGTTRFVAHYQALGDFENRDRIVRTSLVMALLQALIVTGVLGGVVLAFFGPLAEFNTPMALRPAARPTFIIFLCCFFFQLGYIALMRTIEGLQDYRTLRTIDVAYNFFLLSSTALLLHLVPHASLVSIAVFYIVAEMVRWSLAFRAIRRSGIRLSFQGRFIDKESIRELYQFGRPLVLAKLSTLITYRAHAFLIGLFLAVSTMAHYQVAYQAYSIVLSSVGLLTSALLPSIVAKNTQGVKELRKLFFKGSRYVLATSLCVAVYMISVREFIIRTWVGSGYDLAAQLLLLFMFQMFTAYHQGISGLILIGMNKHQWLGKLQWVASIANFTFTLAFLPRLGVQALVGGMIIESFIVGMFYLGLALRSLEVSAGDFIRRVVGPSWLAGTVCALAAWGAWEIIQVLGDYHPFWDAARLASSGIGIGLIVWYMVVDPIDRERIFSLVQRKLNS